MEEKGVYLAIQTPRQVRKKPMYKNGMYRETDKMSDLICENYPMVLVMSRFGIALGFGEKNIGEVCRQNGAEVAYTKEDYAKAIELYEGILKSNGESAAVYYNLGNAYYKAGKIAPAILNYERCLLLDPGDSDARFNLQMARQKTIDKIEPVGDFFLVKWFKSVENLGSADSWAKTGIVCFLLFIGCLILFFFSRWVRLKKIGFYLGVLFIIMVVFANIFASDQKDEMINRKHAIVFAPTVTVKSSPDASGTDLFVLHEGTNVTVKSTLGEWSEIELEDGNVGWMPSKDIEKI